MTATARPSSDVPPWRRLAPGSAAARAVALATMALGGLLLWALVWAPLADRLAGAEDRARLADQRAAALTSAAAALRAEAEIAAPDGEALAAAEAWLAAHAPRRPEGETMLELLSTLRLVARAAEVELASVSPLDAARDPAARDFLAEAELAGLSAHVAEARITADHAGLARFLAALEAVEPTVRATALDVTARSTAAAAEGGRLSATVIVAALSRPPEGG